MIKFSNTSPFSGEENTMELPLTQEEFDAAHKRWQEGTMIQDAFPTLNADQREFILTGITPGEWDDAFGGDE